MSNNSIWPIDMTLSGATTPCKSGPGSDENEAVLCIPQSSSITVASPSDCLVSYAGHSFAEFNLSSEMQSVYSTTSADWVRIIWIKILDSVVKKRNCPSSRKLLKLTIYSYNTIRLHNSSKYSSISTGHRICRFYPLQKVKTPSLPKEEVLSRILTASDGEISVLYF